MFLLLNLWVNFAKNLWDLLDVLLVDAFFIQKGMNFEVLIEPSVLLIFSIRENNILDSYLGFF